MDGNTNHSKRIHFSNEGDLMLLKEVVGHNPYEDPRRWGLIQTDLLQVIGKSISVRTLRERVKKLVEKNLVKEHKDIFKSGTEEPITETDELLREISQIMTEYKQKPSKLQLESSRSSYKKGFCQRENAILNLSANSSTVAFTSDNTLTEAEIEIDDTTSKTVDEISINVSGTVVEGNKENGQATKHAASQRNILNPSRKRACGVKQTTLNYLSKKNDRAYDIQTRDLMLREREQSLKEQQFQLESRERQKRLELEEVRLEMELEVFHNQQKLMELLVMKQAEK